MKTLHRVHQFFKKIHKNTKNDLFYKICLKNIFHIQLKRILLNLRRLHFLKIK
jgi:hypothetical protein